MEVILLERVGRLGQMGDVVRVKDGFARNFLLPRGKALRATDENRTRFESMKSDLQARSAAMKTEASGVADKINGKSFTVLRQASESGQLFGSVSPRDIVSLVGAAGYSVTRNQIALSAPIKMIGQHDGAAGAASGNRNVDQGHCRSQCGRSCSYRARRECHALA